MSNLPAVRAALEKPKLPRIALHQLPNGQVQTDWITVDERDIPASWHFNRTLENMAEYVADELAKKLGLPRSRLSVLSQSVPWNSKFSFRIFADVAGKIETDPGKAMRAFRESAYRVPDYIDI